MFIAKYRCIGKNTLFQASAASPMAIPTRYTNRVLVKVWVWVLDLKIYLLCRLLSCCDILGKSIHWWRVPHAYAPLVFCFLRRRVQLYRISLHRFTGDTLDEIDMHLMSWGNQFSAPVTSAMSGSMFGQACATNAFSVAAKPHVSLP